MALPPNAYAADRREVLRHYQEVAAGGLPVIAYNNPFDTKVDLTLELLAEIAEIDGVVGVKEFSGDVKRVSLIAELAPSLDIYAGADNVVVVEEVLMGAVGWIAGFPSSFPRLCRHLFDLAAAEDIAGVLPLYRRCLRLLIWDARPQFIQAIKLS